MIVESNSADNVFVDEQLGSISGDVCEDNDSRAIVVSSNACRD